jgi:hypothetical protein
MNIKSLNKDNEHINDTLKGHDETLGDHEKRLYYIEHREG